MLLMQWVLANFYDLGDQSFKFKTLSLALSPKGRGDLSGIFLSISLDLKYTDLWGYLSLRPHRKTRLSSDSDTLGVYNTPMNYYETGAKKTRVMNLWDVFAFLLIFAVLILIAWSALQMRTPYELGEALKISLDPQNLPAYAIKTVFRMFIALFFSLLFTFTIGTLAAKNKTAEKFIIPAIDILQSVPVLSFLSIAVIGFIQLFPGSLLGPECAAIFAIFTAQVWNMALGFYQSLKTVPANLKEAGTMFHLSAWQQFWRIEVPFSMPSLLWNTMMSMSASWFFVVVSEAISVSNQSILLPGIGSYITVAIQQADTAAMIYAISAMFVVIFFYDQLIFRPLIKWSDKFKSADLPTERKSQSWFTKLLHRTYLLKYGVSFFTVITDYFINNPLFNRKNHREIKQKNARAFSILSIIFISSSILITLGILLQFIFKTLSLSDFETVFLLGLATSSKCPEQPLGNHRLLYID